MSEPETISKPSAPVPPAARLMRLWPLGLLLVAGLVLCAGWWMTRARLADEIAARAAALRGEGYRIEMSEPQFGGFPYRMKVTIARLQVAAPSGWAVKLGPVEAEALLFDLGHWVFAAENGLTLTRPEGGDVRIGAARLRASLTALDAPTPRLAVEGVDLVVTTPPGARPFSLSRADRIEVYTRTRAADPRSAEALIRLDNAAVTPGTVSAPLFRQRRISAALSLRMIRRDAFQGPSWAAAARNWRSAGGRIEIDPTTPPGPDLRLAVAGGAFILGDDGRLQGAAPLTLTAPDGARIAELGLSLDAEGAALGPLRLGPSPKLF